MPSGAHSPRGNYPNLPRFYYYQGGCDFERLSMSDKIAMRMFFRVNTKVAKVNLRATEILHVMGDRFGSTN